MLCVSGSSLLLSNVFDILSYISGYLYPLSISFFEKSHNWPWIHDRQNIFVLDVGLGHMKYCVLKTLGVLIFCEDKLDNLFPF